MPAASRPHRAHLPPPQAPPTVSRGRRAADWRNQRRYGRRNLLCGGSAGQSGGGGGGRGSWGRGGGCGGAAGACPGTSWGGALHSGGGVHPVPVPDPAEGTHLRPGCHWRARWPVAQPGGGVCPVPLPNPAEGAHLWSGWRGVEPSRFGLSAWPARSVECSAAAQLHCESHSQT